MSQITRCPACATMFKVVPDQLRVSEGWVRCGQCSEVFDANLHLQSPSAAVQVPGVPSPPEVRPVEESLAAPAVPRIDIQIPGAEPEPVRVVTPEPALVEPEPLQVAKAAAEPFLDGALTAVQAESGEGVVQGSVPEDGETFHHAFLKPRGAPVKPRRRWLNVTLALTSGLLGMTLLLQVAVRERDRIVALEPGARAALEPVCGVVGCSIAPLHQIESVVIDSSSFTKLRGDVYRLAFTLKNTSHLPLATPALELSLTDLQDQTVVRKVFLAPDFADQRVVLEPGSELPVNLPMALKLASDSGEKVAGYRLLSFYP